MNPRGASSLHLDTENLENGGSRVSRIALCVRASCSGYPALEVGLSLAGVIKAI